jgi:hypothetical protein
MSEVVVQKMEQAREQLAKGKLGSAVEYLGDAACGTRDPRLLHEMHEMAEEGLERSGRFSKGEWKRVLKTLDKKLAANGVPKRETAGVA